MDRDVVRPAWSGVSPRALVSWSSLAGTSARVLPRTSVRRRRRRASGPGRVGRTAGVGAV